MPVTTTAHFSFTVDNQAGTTSFKVKYRLSGTSIWSTLNTSGTTVSVPDLIINRLYDFQVTNINGADNPSSQVVQSISITDPMPFISSTNSSVGYYFNNLSEDIDTYTATVAEFDSPGVILATEVYNPANPVVGEFTGLTPLVKYYLTITPAANQFFKTFYYTFTTTAEANCPAPQDITAYLS